MTIDEAYNMCFGKPYIVPIDKHEEARNIIRDLIEEVKQYREIGTVEECRNRVLDIYRAYNKAIDDFYNALAYDLIWIKERFGDDVYTDLWCDVGTRAEQLKAGEENEQSI